MIGSKLGPYEIVASIGSGGMGEVYRARDPRLKRDIAIKILPAEVVSNPERQKRFQIEAQAASALNHPNILSVYDIGSENGSYYMVSELIEGDSLRKFIQRGPLPVKQLLEIAVQIASGLASAHEAGIVHRDLKPENIMVTRDGRAKILDFGLAKLRTFPGGEEDETVSHTLTQTGLIQGTIPYMSPEQAAGKPIDFRSDQFSLGLILYEMTTGKRAFARNSGVQTLSAIISEEFPPIRTQNPRIPAPLCWLIERCLSKESRLRYHSTADLEQELRGLQAHLAEAASTVSIASTPSKKFIGKKVIIALLALALLAAVFAAVRLFRTGSDTSLSSYRFTPLATDQAPEDDAAWSPDGKSIAYTAQVKGAQQIFTRSLSSLMNERVTQWEKQSTKPFWSPDGTRIYFFSKGEQQMSLWAIGVAGGSPVKILENAIPPGTISSDGKTLVFFREDSLMNRSLWVSTPPGSTPKKLQAISDNHYGTAIAHFSPDGSKLGVWLWPWRGTSTSSFSEFWILPYPQGKPYKVVQDLSDREVRSFSWMPDNSHFVFESSSHSMTGSNIWMADTKLNRIEPITVNMQNESNPSVSPDGQKIAFTVLTSDSNLVEVPLHGASMRSLLSTSRYEEFPSWAPSGDAYAYVADRYGAMGIWLRSLTLEWERPLVTASDFDKDATVRFQSPSFSPDGRRILYRRLAVKGEPAIWISNIAGGPPVRLVQEDRGHGLATWSPDGNWIAYVYAIPGTFGLAKIKVGSGERPIDLTNVIPVRTQDSPKWSPTGNWISCQTQEGLVLISPDGRNKRILSSDRPIIHGWSKDGSRIYTIRDAESLQLILTSIDIENLRETRLSELGSSQNLASVLGFSMNPDGKSFATSVEYWNSDLWLLEGFNMRPSLWNRIFGN